jgi:alpha-galactosidase/6-phospho-beta-glucosidase family protein
MIPGYNTTQQADLNLIQSIETHLKSVAAFNVYNNGSRKDIPLNTSGDYNLTNEVNNGL